MAFVVVRIIREKMTFRPIEMRNSWVNFSFNYLDIENNCVQITLNDSRHIFKIHTSWWLKHRKIKLYSQETEKLNSHSSLKINNLNSFNNNTVLQIDYELSNGDRYVHLISGEKKSVKKQNLPYVYCEKIFFVNGENASLVGIQNAVIKQEFKE